MRHVEKVDVRATERRIQAALIQAAGPVVPGRKLNKKALRERAGRMRPGGYRLKVRFYPSGAIAVRLEPDPRYRTAQ